MRLAAKSGRYLLPTAVAALAAAAVALLYPLAWTLAAPLLAALVGMLWFFRDPERRPAGPGLVSPADGKVLHATETDEETRVAIFMSPLDVHVNRAPLDARVDAIEYHRGSHVPAFRKDSDRNERLELDLSGPRGPVRVRLIAGTVARRIHPYLAPGAAVKKGDRIGLIAFGSRCELVLPAKRYKLLVAPGARVKAGETPLAEEWP